MLVIFIPTSFNAGIDYALIASLSLEVPDECPFDIPLSSQEKKAAWLE
jgi:hypothetical protein